MDYNNPQNAGTTLLISISKTMDMFRIKQTCVFMSTKMRIKSTMIVFLHVDDIALACNDPEMMKNEKKGMQRRFEMQDLGEVSHVLGVKISRKREKLVLRILQRNYLEKVLDHFQVKDCKPVSTPIEPI